MNHNPYPVRSHLAQPQMFKPAETLHELRAYIREAKTEYERNDKGQLNRLVEIGKGLIRLKELCTEIGQWTKELEGLHLSRSEASRAMRVSQLPTATLTACKSAYEAINLLPAESSTEHESRTGQPKVESNGQGTQRIRELAQTRVSPTALDIKGGEITDTVQLREPGEEGDEEEEDLGKLITRMESAWTKKVDALAKMRDVTPKQVAEAKAKLQAAMKAMKELNNAPYRKVPDPEPGKCKRCHCDVLLVTSTKGNSFNVDGPHKRGQFRLEGGLAIFVSKEERKNHKELYQAHKRVCFGPRRNGKAH